jgi:hypothetical protein
MMQSSSRFVLPRPVSAAFILTVAEFAAALIILLFLPIRDVTQPAYGSHAVLEYLLPGSSPQWRQWGGIVLVAWVAVLLQWLVSLSRIGTNVLGGFPNIQRAFAVPAVDQPQNVFQENAPYMLAGLALLYAINAVLIWRSRRQA